MKPKIFLSHSTADKEFIYKVANDLRNAQIDVWVDEWEIPLGESIRKKIFEEGIPFCDLFFIYITENSINSYWVQKELDSAIILESERKNSFLALFVEKNDLRDRLSPDLKSIIIPELNKDNYLLGFSKLVSKAWFTYSKKYENNINNKYRIKLLESENEILKLKSEIVRLNISGQYDISNTVKKMEETKVNINDKNISLKDIFELLKYEIASGVNDYRIAHIIKETYNKGREIEEFGLLSFITGFFVLNNISKIQEGTDNSYQLYFLTDFGKNVANSI
jgi:hypothetical protein